eukprot:m.52172 g.52172  ORF g.52172 m.52172 type:complete len:215 (-) comp11288_c1_seq1:85-729(-)
MAMSRQASTSAQDEKLFKILVIGDFSVGKTCVIQRYTREFFDPETKATLGVDFAIKRLQRPGMPSISLQLWDIAGHERFSHMTRVYYKHAIAAVVCFDLSRAVTLDGAAKWKQDVDAKVMLPDGKPIPVVLFGCKSDAVNPNEAIEDSTIQEFCTEHGIAEWFKTSSKEDKGITEAFNSLLDRILDVQPAMNPTASSGKVSLNAMDGDEDSCCN